MLSPDWTARHSSCTLALPMNSRREFIATTVAVNNAYPGRKFILTVIDAGHWLGVMLIIGAVIGARGL